MAKIVGVIALAAALACAWVALSHLSRMLFKRGSWALEWPALTLPLYGGACVACLTAAGLVPAAPGAIFAVALLGTAVVLLGDSWMKARRLPNGSATLRVLAAVGQQIRGGGAYMREDVMALHGLLRRDPVPEPAVSPAAGRRPGRAGGSQPGRPAQPQAAAPAAGAARAIPIPPASGNPLRDTAPHVREDPELGDPGQPDSIAKDLTSSGVIVPAWYAQAAMMIATSEPDTEDDHLAEIAGDAAGVLALAGGFMTRAENLLHGAGLDPAIVAAHFDAAEEVAGLAAAVALLYKRYQAVYGDVSEAVAAGLVLPDDAKTWFSGGTAPAAGDEQAA